jgi:hypothetical protein
MESSQEQKKVLSRSFSDRLKARLHNAMAASFIFEYGLRLIRFPQQRRFVHTC